MPVRNAFHTHFHSLLGEMSVRSRAWVYWFGEWVRLCLHLSVHERASVTASECEQTWVCLCVYDCSNVLYVLKFYYNVSCVCVCGLSGGGRRSFCSARLPFVGLHCLCMCVCVCVQYACACLGCGLKFKFSFQMALASTATVCAYACVCICVCMHIILWLAHTPQNLSECMCVRVRVCELCKNILKLRRCVDADCSCA